MARSDYLSIVNEYFDINDTKTRGYVLSVTEAEQNQVMINLAGKLYNAIVKKVADIDFGKIPDSKGDIAQIPNYMDLIDSLNAIRDIILHENQSTATIDIVFTAIDNVKKYRATWQKAFALKCDLITLFYNTITLSIVSSISLFIATAVEMVKNPVTGVVDIELDKVMNINTKDALLFKNLKNFNKSCESGEMEKIFADLLKGQKATVESAIAVKDIDAYNDVSFEQIDEAISLGAVAGVVGMIPLPGALKILLSAVVSGYTILKLIKLILPAMHLLTTMLYNLRQSLSDYLSGEADLIRLNAEKVNYNNAKTEEQKQKIIKKQLKIADRFNKWANKLAVKIKKAEHDTIKQVEEEKNEKVRIEDLDDSDVDNSGLIF